MNGKGSFLYGKRKSRFLREIKGKKKKRQSFVVFEREVREKGGKRRVSEVWLMLFDIFHVV